MHQHPSPLALCNLHSRIVRGVRYRCLNLSGSRRAGSSLSHEERTAAGPRGDTIHSVQLGSIEIVNDRVRLLRLQIVDKQRGIKFRPGQWLDVFVPGISKAGGFTITSTPSEAEAHPSPFLELAVQKSSKNPPAAWFWRPEDEILGTELRVRVGGAFVWPPPRVELGSIERVVFVAGGVGINPLVSILCHLWKTETMPMSVEFIYSSRVPPGEVTASDILYLSKLQAIASFCASKAFNLRLFVTNRDKGIDSLDGISNIQYRRIEESDLREAIGDVERRSKTIAYVCGPPFMTDEMVGMLRNQLGMDADRVLCEKWW